MKILPHDPHIGHLKRQARRLQRAVRASDDAALAAVRHYDRAYDRTDDEAVADGPFSVLDAQRIVARQYGFRSWPALARYVERARGTSPEHDPALAKRLLAQWEDSRAMIERTKARPRKGRSREDVFHELVGPQSRDADALAGVLSLAGWPTVERVGHAAAEAMHMTVANAFTQGPLNHLAIEHLGVRVCAGEAPAGWLAMLVDRADLMSGSPVPYGIVGDFDADGRISSGNDVIDPPNLDRRRATVGYVPIEEQNRAWFEQAAREGLNVRPDRDAYYRDVETVATLGSWR